MTEMQRLAPRWLEGCRLRECWFEPTFHKHAGQLCHGVQIHTEGADYDHRTFQPWRIQALAFKAIRRLYRDYPLWRDFAYEYEHGRLPIDVINGSRCCGNGSTMRRRYRRTWMRWHERMNRRGRPSVNNTFATDGGRRSQRPVR